MIQAHYEQKADTLTGNAKGNKRAQMSMMRPKRQTGG
jgi:hypothetical protein